SPQHSATPWAPTTRPPSLSLPDRMIHQEAATKFHGQRVILMGGRPHDKPAGVEREAHHDHAIDPEPVPDARRDPHPQAAVEGNRTELWRCGAQLPAVRKERRPQRAADVARELDGLREREASPTVKPANRVPPPSGTNGRPRGEDPQIEALAQPLDGIKLRRRQLARTRHTAKPQSGRLNTDCVGCIPLSGGRGGT
ncbi:MAG: hypothetical protein ACRDHJ_12065, partial [Actinomycetota bacterium]